MYIVIGYICFYHVDMIFLFVFFFQAEDGIRDGTVTGVQTCALPIYGAAGGRGRIPVVRVGLDVGTEGVHQLVQLIHLVGGECFGGKQVQGPRAGLFEDTVEDGQVVAQRFSASCRRDDDDVPALVHGRECVSLVRVQGGNPPPAQRPRKRGGDRGGERRELGWLGGELSPRRDSGRAEGIRSELIENLIQSHAKGPMRTGVRYL